MQCLLPLVVAFYSRTSLSLRHCCLSRRCWGSNYAEGASGRDRFENLQHLFFSLNQPRLITTDSCASATSRTTGKTGGRAQPWRFSAQKMLELRRFGQIISAVVPSPNGDSSRV